MKFTRTIVTNDLTDRGFYLLDSAIDSLINSYNERTCPVFYGHNYEDIKQYVAYSIIGSARKSKGINGIDIDFNTIDSDNGKLFEMMLLDKEIPMGFSVGIKITDYEYDENSGLINIIDADGLEFSGTPIPTDKNTFDEGVNIILQDLEEDSLLASFSKWTNKYIASLPDSSFAVIEKDFSTGKISDKRARHLPFKDKNGKVDIPHLRNALARMNQIEAVGESETSEQLRLRAKKILIPVAKEYLPDTKWGKMEDDIMDIDPKVVQGYSDFLKETDINKNKQKEDKKKEEEEEEEDPEEEKKKKEKEKAKAKKKEENEKNSDVPATTEETKPTFTLEQVNEIVKNAVEKEVKVLLEARQKEKVFVYGDKLSSDPKQKEKLDWNKFINGNF